MLIATPAFAQDAEETNVVDVIVVTAEKREQDLQEVPIAITAMSGDTLGSPVFRSGGLGYQ